MHIITACRIQLSACLKSYKGSQLYNRFRSQHGHQRRTVTQNLQRSLFQQPSSILFNNSFTSTKDEKFSVSKFKSSKLFPCLNHIQQSRFEVFFMLNIQQIPKIYIWRSTQFKIIATLHTATSLTLNSVTDIFL